MLYIACTCERTTKLSHLTRLNNVRNMAAPWILCKLVFQKCSRCVACFFCFAVMTSITGEELIFSAVAEKAMSMFAHIAYLPLMFVFPMLCCMLFVYFSSFLFSYVKSV